MKKIVANIPAYIQSIVELEEKQRYSAYSYPQIQNNTVKKYKFNEIYGNFIKQIVSLLP